MAKIVTTETGDIDEGTYRETYHCSRCKQPIESERGWAPQVPHSIDDCIVALADALVKSNERITTLEANANWPISGG